MYSTWCTVGILPEVLNLILHRCKDYKFDNTPDPMDETQVMIEKLFQDVLRFLTAFARFFNFRHCLSMQKSVIN